MNRYSTLVENLQKASIPVRELAGAGYAAVTLAAGRVMALAFEKDGPNLIWSHPQLGDNERVRNRPQDLVGGMGGDRLWFAPELSFHWDGQPDWETFANYKVPAAADPGEYEFAQEDPQSVTLRAKGALPVHGTDRLVGFEVERTIRMTEPPLAKTDPLMGGIDYAGIESSHRVRIAANTRTGLIGLWHLLQVPAGAVLIVPIKKTSDAAQSKPLSYGLPGAWVERPDHISWRYSGAAKAKFGLSAAVLTGRSAVLRELKPGYWCLIVRDFPVDPAARYADHPYGVPRTDQALQAWDGFEFGEMEFHSRVLDAERGPRELTESDRLWAFGGSPLGIAALAARLLGVDVGYVVTET